MYIHIYVSARTREFSYKNVNAARFCFVAFSTSPLSCTSYIDYYIHMYRYISGIIIYIQEKYICGNRYFEMKFCNASNSICFRLSNLLNLHLPLWYVMITNDPDENSLLLRYSKKDKCILYISIKYSGLLSLPCSDCFIFTRTIQC